MARKEIDHTILADGRDKGKSFHIKEMPALTAQDFADRIFFAAMNSGINIPDGLHKLGMEGLWSVGIQMAYKIPYDWARPMLNMLMDCITINTEAGTTRKLVESDIEEFTTVYELRKEVLKLHFSFFVTGDGSTSATTPTPETIA